MKRWLFVDDERFPPAKGEWTIARSSAEPIAMMSHQGCPEFISFDHDLGGEDKAMAIVHFMVEQDLDFDKAWIPRGFAYTVHSENPVGAQNIHGLLGGYLRERELRQPSLIGE